MSNRFLVSVAAVALVAGAGFANAQSGGMSREGGAGGAAATQHSAPAGGAMNHDSGSAGMKGSDSGMKGADSTATKGSEPGMKASESEKAPPAAGKTAQDNMGQKSKSTASETDTKSGAKGGNMNADSKTGADSKTAADSKTGADTKSGNMNAQKTTTDTKSQTTTGNAATSATAAPPAEKRTQINTAFKSEKIEETTNVNFNISVGATIPATVRFHPVPARIVEIYPEWRGYDVVFVHGRYIIVRPQTHEIVYIIEG